MQSIERILSDLSSVNEKNFEDIALEVFRYQSSHNSVYHSYLTKLGVEPTKIASLSQIPFLPISFFKTHDIISGGWEPEKAFFSSGTTGMVTSRHLVKSTSFYLFNTTRIFEQVFGPLHNYHILALLPSYLEREGSSLIEMMADFIEKSQSNDSGFYLFNQEDLLKKIAALRAGKKKVIVWGVSFALLDLAEKFEVDLSHCIIIETGGMKGRRKEWIREELHEYLCKRFNVGQIGSEYGMTELMSQAYSTADGLYRTPGWMNIFIREVNDPYVLVQNGRVGGINIVDLANVHTCSFIETQDLGKIDQKGYFTVLGRMDNTDIRGCNLLVG